VSSLSQVICLSTYKGPQNICLWKKWYCRLGTTVPG